MIFGLLYATFSYLYYDTGHVQPIYPVLDWSKPAKAVRACSIIITLALVMQFLFFLLYVGRITLSAHLNGRGKIVVEKWWKLGSQATPVKDASKDIEVVECVEMVKTEASDEAKVDFSTK
nr:hypothetical transcript [Hymenolepis microstoma]CDS31821.1 expressed protein [Hymenolepis microstoma]